MNYFISKTLVGILLFCWDCFIVLNLFLQTEFVCKPIALVLKHKALFVNSKDFLQTYETCLQTYKLFCKPIFQFIFVEYVDCLFFYNCCLALNSKIIVSFVTYLFTTNYKGRHIFFKYFATNSIFLIPISLQSNFHISN